MTTRKTPVVFRCSCTSMDVRKEEEGEHLCGGLQAARPSNYLVTRGVIKFLRKIPVFMTSKSNGEWEMREKKNPQEKVQRVEEMHCWQRALPGGAKLDHPQSLLAILYTLCFHMTGKISHSLMRRGTLAGFVCVFSAMKTQTQDNNL